MTAPPGVSPGGAVVSALSALVPAGLDDLAIADLIQSAAFFNWANRLMLSLGEPTPAIAA